VDDPADRPAAATVQARLSAVVDQKRIVSSGAVLVADRLLRAFLI
jgi:hypothetical protein